MTEQRMISFEIKISHQEHAIEVLQQIVYEQQKTIDTLQLQIQHVAKRLNSDVQGRNEIGPANEKPPHY